MAEQLKSIIGICDGFNFVLPANMVAETVSGVSVTSVPTPQPWQIGEINWHGMNLPVVSLEQIVLGRSSRLRGSHVAIVRGTSNTETLPFYGVPVQTQPNEYRLLSDMEIIEAEVPEHFNFVTTVARIRGVNCIVPKIDALEKQVAGDIK